jgi:hypothetical protein
MDWMKDTLIPELKEWRRPCHYSSPAFSLLDNCSAHLGPEVSILPNQNNLHLLYIPLHSSRLPRCLDASVFGITKRLIANPNPTENVNTKTSRMIQLMNAFLAAAVRTNIIKSFRHAGISLSRDGKEIRHMALPRTLTRFDE